jgi:DNA-binding CsgD family transcriptional regulator
MSLLERATELSLFGRLVDDLESGAGSVVVIGGPAGAGRSALLMELARRSRERGLPVVVAGFSALEHTVGDEFPDDDGVPQQVVCVDDVQHADADSLRRIIQLAYQVRVRPVLLAITISAVPPGAAGFVELRTVQHCHRIALAGLSVEAAARLAADEYGLTIAPRRMVELMSVVGSDLTLLRAILADHAAYAHVTGPCGLRRLPGSAFHRAMLDRYYRLGPEVREVAQAMAVMTDFGTPRSIAQVAATTVGVVEDAISGLTAVGLMEHRRFRHPSAATAIVADLPIQRANELNVRAADVMRGMGAPAVEVARRLIAADYADETWTDFLLEETVPQAVARDDRQVAVEALNLALRGARHDSERGAILERIGLAHAATDPELCCQYLHEATALAPRGDAWALRSTLLADQYARRGRAGEATARLAATAVDFAGAPLTLAELETDRLLVCGDVPQLLATTAALARPEDVVLSARYELARSLTDVLIGSRDNADVAKTARNAVYGVALTETAVPSLLAALSTLVYAGDLEVAGSVAENLAQESRERRAPVWAARFLAVAAETALRAGRYADAVEHGEHALTMVSRPAWGVRIGAATSPAILGCLMTDDVATARRHLSAGVPEAMFETRYGLHHLYARGHVRLAEGQAGAALVDFMSCGRLMQNWGIDHEHVLPWRLAAAGAALAVGDVQRAVDLIERRLAVRTRESVPSDLRQQRTVRERVFHLLAKATQRGGLIEAIVHIRAADLAQLPDRPTARYKIEDRYSSYLDKLTYSEQQVALLAATGRSNRNIARSLSVTISTVEQHLTRVYRKLELSGRQELRARLG